MIFKIDGSRYLNAPIIEVYGHDHMKFIWYKGDHSRSALISLTAAEFERAVNEATRRGQGILDVTSEGISAIKRKKLVPSGPSIAAP